MPLLDFTLIFFCLNSKSSFSIFLFLFCDFKCLLIFHAFEVPRRWIPHRFCHLRKLQFNYGIPSECYLEMLHIFCRIIPAFFCANRWSSATPLLVSGKTPSISDGWGTSFHTSTCRSKIISTKSSPEPSIVFYLGPALRWSIAIGPAASWVWSYKTLTIERPCKFCLFHLWELSAGFQSIRFYWLRGWTLDLGIEYLQRLIMEFECSPFIWEGYSA